MNVLYFICAVALISFPALQTRAEVCDDFGVGVTQILSPKSDRGITDFNGDYNGDGVMDRLVFLRLKSEPLFAEDVNSIMLLEEEPLYPPRGDSIAIGIILQGKKAGECRKYIVYEDGFFSLAETGMWRNPENLPVDLIKKGDKLYRFWKKQTKDLKTDAIQIISSSLAEILVYWNGKTFVARWNEFAGEP